jgi:hypothetical protein
MDAPGLPGNRRFQSHEIAGHTYQITPADAETVDGAIARCLSMVSLKALRPDDFKFLVALLRQTTKVGIIDTLGDGRTTWVPLDACYKDHFAGPGQAAYVAWLPIAFEVSFGSFLGALPDAFIALTARFRSTFQKVQAGFAGVSSSAKS